MIYPDRIQNGGQQIPMLKTVQKRVRDLPGAGFFFRPSGTTTQNSRVKLVTSKTIMTKIQCVKRRKVYTLNMVSRFSYTYFK